MCSLTASSPTQGAFRDGKLLIVTQGSQLPAICLECGQPISREPRKRTYYWHNPWLFFLILAGLLIYVIVALIVRKRFQLYLPLCETHRRARRRVAWAAAFLLIGIIPVGILIGSTDTPNSGLWAVLVMFLMFFAGLACWALSSGPLRPTLINESYGRFKGTREAFLSQLPPKPHGFGVIV